MAIRVLGPVQVDGSGPLSPRDRVVLAALTLHPGDAVSAEGLADALWGDVLPRSWQKVVQGCVVRLRGVLGKDAVQTVAGGYRLVVTGQEVDSQTFERLARRGRDLAKAGEDRRALGAFTEALSLWRGPALDELEHWSPGRSEASRLGELRHTVQEELVEVEIHAGKDAVPDATALVTAEPLRERRWALLATALYQDHRQADALAALRQARHALREELGIDPSPDLVALERAILNHDPGLESAPHPAKPERDVCPYLGLVPYDRGDAEWFFGRVEEVDRSLRALAKSPLLVVVGPSGCGKSSLIRAGVVPSLERSGRRVAVVSPGPDPQSALVSAISAPGVGHALVVDQLEELFTAGHDAAVIVAFLDRLADLASSGWAVIVVVRADQMSGLATSAAFARRAEQSVHLVAPMTEAEMSQAIAGPATQAGLRLEPGLLQLLLREVEGETGALPLLSHALAETWIRREADVLTVDGYLATGGIRGAVARSAELLYESLDANQRAAVRSILLRLVTPSLDGEPVAARAPFQVVAGDSDRARVLDLLVKARLLTTDERTVTLAHEAVVRAWPRLHSWLDDDVAGQRSLRHIAVAAEDWAARGRPESELYRGGRLEAAIDWRGADRPDLTPLEAEFLAASERLASTEQEAGQRTTRQQARSNRRLRLALAGTASGLALALVASTFAAQQDQKVQRTALTAQVHNLTAQSLALRGTDRQLAALLALQAYRLQPDATTSGGLFGTLAASPGFLGYLPVPVALTSGHLLGDGRTLLASGVDGDVREIDWRTGETRRLFPRPSEPFASAATALSRDEQVLAEVSWQGREQVGEASTLTVFDVKTASLRVRETRLPLSGMRTVAVSPDGMHVAVSGEKDGQVIIIDTPEGAAPPDLLQDSIDGLPGVRRLPPPRLRSSPYSGLRPRAAIAFTSDGTLVVGSEGGVVRLVDLDGHVKTVLTGAKPLTSNEKARVSDDDSLLLTTGSRGVALWDLRSRRLIWSKHLDEGGCTVASFAPTIGAVLCASNRGAVVALDLRDGAQTGQTFDLQRGNVADLVMTPNGRSLVELADTRPVIARWDLDGTGPVTRFLTDGAVPGQYNADGTLLLATPTQSGGHGRPTQEIVDSRSGRVLNSVASYGSAVWTASPSVLTVWDDSGNGSQIDPLTGRRAGLGLEGNLTDAPTVGHAVLRGHLLLAWSGKELKTVWKVWDEVSREIVAEAQDYIALGWTSASLAANGRLLVTADQKQVTTYDISDPSSGAVLKVQRSGLENVAVSPDGVLVASRDDGTIAFYDPLTLRGNGLPIAGEEAIEQFAFSADGRLMVARGADGQVYLVDMKERAALGDAPALDSLPHRNLALSPDGHELALAAPNGIVVWDLQPEDWVRAACGLVGRDLTPGEWASYLQGLGSYHPSCAKATG